MDTDGATEDPTDGDTEDTGRERLKLRPHLLLMPKLSHGTTATGMEPVPTSRSLLVWRLWPPVGRMGIRIPPLRLGLWIPRLQVVVNCPKLMFQNQPITASRT